jgi:cyclopropane fatty-acyl-phospholipid synthase-like methyltransferase
MKDFWNERYTEPGYAYGTDANAFLISEAQRLQPGMRALVVGDGEGRNGVWLAQQGLAVTSVDYSATGVERAHRLAAERGVTLDIHCADMNDWQWPAAHFDAVVSIFVHFPSVVRAAMHGRMLAALRPGGMLIMEAFNRAQLDYPSGGPPSADALFSVEMLLDDFSGADIELCREQVVQLNEGKYHVGPGAVVRLIAHRPVTA